MTQPTPHRPGEQPRTLHRADGLLALWITDDGGITTVTLPADPGERGEFIAGLVDGLFDVVALDERTDMWVNDDGLFRWGPNVMATRVAGAHGFDYQAYHGPAVLTGGYDHRGDTQGLDDTSATVLASIAFYGAAEGPLRLDEIDGHRFARMDERRHTYGA